MLDGKLTLPKLCWYSPSQLCEIRGSVVESRLGAKVDIVKPVLGVVLRGIRSAVLSPSVPQGGPCGRSRPTPNLQSCTNNAL